MSVPQERKLKASGVDWITEDCYRLALEWGSAPPQILPGQFFMLRIPSDDWPLLPRPFSIYRVVGSKLVFLIKSIGPGTRALSQLATGQTVCCTGPLGSPFPSVGKEGVVILAGGIGIAPFPHFVEALQRDGVAGERIHLVFGARNQDQLYDQTFFKEKGARLIPATDDGSVGFHGNAIACLDEELRSGRIEKSLPVIACGPERMLEAAWRWAKDSGAALYLSLETYMACGIGICNGCSVSVKPEFYDGWPYAKACREGPTFPASHLRWE